MYNQTSPLAWLFLSLFVLASLAQTVSAQEASDSLLPSSPLDPCTSSGNCVHEAYVFDRLPSELAKQAMQALEGNKHLDSVKQGTVDYHRIDAVFNAWMFKDDVSIAIEVHQEGSVLFIKSQSRDGKYDLGVNKRRVKRLIAEISGL